MASLSNMSAVRLYLKRASVVAVLVFVCFVTIILYRSEIHRQPLVPKQMPPSQSNQNNVFSKYNSFKNALLAKANGRGEIILTPTDMGYASMALNLYETSLVKLNISYYLFVGSDEQVCGYLNNHGADCYSDFDGKNGSEASSFGTADFNRKTHFKIKLILDSLLLNHTVLIVDADIVFFKNPFEHFHCMECDIQIQNNGRRRNSGFYLSRPTKPSINLHEKAWKLSQQPNAKNDQILLTLTMKTMIEQNAIEIHILSDALFPAGRMYFEKGKRMFFGDNPCKDCVIVHNNWIVSYDAKELRFKENGLWGVDIDGYYGNPDTRYILYSSGTDFANEHTLERELNALKNALSIGYLLNRTVILPSFTCYGCRYSACNASHGRCSFHTHYRVTTFNEHFYGKYREHVFLQLKKVPESIKQSVSPVYTIERSQLESSSPASQRTGSAKILTPHDVVKGASASEIVSWFGNLKYSVLQFSSLEGIFGGFPESVHQFDEINKKLGHAFSSAGYRQFWSLNQSKLTNVE